MFLCTEKNDVSSDEEEETEDQAAGGDEDPEEKDEKPEDTKSECTLDVRILHVRNQSNACHRFRLNACL